MTNTLTTNNKEIIKEADMLANFVSGALGRVKDDINLREKPFETIFSVMTPVIALRFGFLLGSIIIAADYAFGVGPSALGRMIDDYLKIGGKKDIAEMDFSESNLEKASKFSIGQIWSTLQSKAGMESKSTLQDIMVIKGCVTPNDVKASFYVGLYKESQPWGYRRPWFGRRYSGYWGTRMGFFRRFMSGMRYGGRLPFFSAALLGLLKAVASGLAFFMATGGIAKMVGLKSKKEREIRKETPSAFTFHDVDPLLPSKLRSQTMQYYSNVAGDVEDTLIKFLDSSIANFSKAFQSVNGMPLKGSAKMKAILQDVQLLNWGNLNEINKREAFVAPRVINLAKKLLPEANYARIKATPLVKKRPSPAPVQKKVQEKPSKIEELSGLLQGAH